MIFIPLASAAVGPKVASPLLLIIDIVASVGMLPNAWRRADRKQVGTMICGAVLGVPLGAVVLVWADPAAIRWAIVALVVLMLAFLASGWRYEGRPSVPMTVGVGLVAGVLSGIAQAGGPPVVAYWLGGPSPSTTVRANVVLYFALSSALTLVTYLAGGLITRQVLVLSIAAGPLYALGLYLGSLFFGRASDAVFRRACYGLIAGAAVLGLPILDGLIR